MRNLEVIIPKGTVKVTVEIDNISKSCVLLVVEGATKALLGRDLINIFNLS